MFTFLKAILSIFWLLLTIGVLVSLWRNRSLSSASKILWTLGVLFFPILGPVLFILFGERSA